MKLYPAIVNGKIQKNYYIDDEGNPWSTKNGNARMMAPGINSSGYYTVSYCYFGKTKSYNLHRVVAETLISFPCPEGIEKEDWNSTPDSVKKLLIEQYMVNHKDHDKTNYHPSNLEWVSSKGNARAYQKHKRTCL